jgi:glycosyltransferase involved in cell wall biosynthesis
MGVALDSAYEVRRSFRPTLEVITPAPVVDVVLPVYNEEDGLARTVRSLSAYLTNEFPFTARITIADGASSDRTWAVATLLAGALSNVRLLHLNEKGRGRAIAAGWLTSEARVVASLDFNRSINLSALLPLVAPVISGHSDVSIGSRSTRHISRLYDLLLQLGLGVRIRDAQSGLLATRAEIARLLVPAVQNRNRFFEAELLLVAERAGLSVHELPLVSSSVSGSGAASAVGGRFITG